MKVACETCGETTHYEGTKRCNNCWEVERRIESYLDTKGGLLFIKDLLCKRHGVHVAEFPKRVPWEGTLDKAHLPGVADCPACQESAYGPCPDSRAKPCIRVGCSGLLHMDEHSEIDRTGESYEVTDYECDVCGYNEEGKRSRNLVWAQRNKEKGNSRW